MGYVFVFTFYGFISIIIAIFLIRKFAHPNDELYELTLTLSDGTIHTYRNVYDFKSYYNHVSFTIDGDKYMHNDVVSYSLERKQK